MELNQVKQRPAESARELGNRIKKLASLAFRGKDRGSKATREEMSLNRFTLVLHRKDLWDVVFGAEFSNLKQAIDKAEYPESYHKRDYESKKQKGASSQEFKQRNQGMTVWVKVTVRKRVLAQERLWEWTWNTHEKAWETCFVY